MRNLKVTLSALLLASGLSGCGGPASDPTAIDPNSGTADIPSQGRVVDELAWMQSHGRLIAPPAFTEGVETKASATLSFSTSEQSSVQLGLTDSGWLCVLTGLAGGGTGTLYGTVWDNNPGGWQLGTSTGSAAWAECTPWSNFARPSGSAIWVSPTLYSTTAQSDATGTSGWKTDSSQAWWGDAITAISGTYAMYQGFGEWIQITQSTSGFGPSTIWSHSEVAGNLYTQANAQSVFIGVPNSGRLVRLIGYQNGAYGLSDATHADTEFAASTQSGYSSFWLATTDSAICYLTMFSGAFNGYGESVRILKQSGRWLLSTTRGGGTAQGRARCMAYDQR
jgi:hypothetical protein